MDRIYEFNQDMINELMEDNQKVVIYGGRFQPFHKGHYSVYEGLVKEFGKDNVFIATSNKVELPNSPFNFNEIKSIMTTMFGISEEKIVETRSPYQPVEILKNYDENSTIYINALSEKDALRFKGVKKDGSPSYFQPYDEYKNLESFADRGYFIIVPVYEMKIDGENISGTKVRQVLGTLATDANEKRAMFIKLYGKYDEDIFNLVTDKLINLHNEFIQIDKELVSEFFNNIDIVEMLEETQINNNIKIQDIGFEILKYINNDKESYKTLSESLGYKMLEFLDINIRDLDKQKLITDNRYSNDRLLTEGGAAGHMQHIFEDNSLTFGDLKTIIIQSLTGELSEVSEKLDGQNLMVSWKNGELIAARNKGHIKNHGETALSISAMKEKFKGRGEIENVFVYSMTDLQNAIKKLPADKIDAIFMNGKRFMNLELLYVKTENVIPYDKNAIIFHGLVEFDEAGTPLEYSTDSVTLLNKMIFAVNAHVQEVFNIEAPVHLQFPEQIKDLEKKKKYYISQVEKIQKENDIHDNETISVYYDLAWSDFISNKAKEMNYKISNVELSNLVRRWSKGDKGYSVRDMKNNLKDEKFLAWALEFDKNEYKDKVKEIVRPLEYLFLELGVDILQQLSGYMSVNPDQSVQKLKVNIVQTIKLLKTSKDPDILKKLRVQLEKIHAIGGIDKIAPTEGIVFKYKGKTYKLTGLFAPLNALSGIIKFGN